MPDSKITALTALTAADPAVDMFPVVDVSDTTMAASGTTKRISINNILACSPTATLASATITGDLTVRTNVISATSSGVGFGINTAAAAIDVVSSFQWRSNTGGTDKLAIFSGGAGLIYLGSTTASALSFLYNGSTAMTLNSTGLGVGQSPTAPLHIYSAATGTGPITNVVGTFRTGAAGRDVSLQFSDTANQAYVTMLSGALLFGTGGATERVRIDAAGQVGIGVTPNPAWNVGSGKTIQLTANASLSGGLTNSTFLAQNWYHDNTNSRYLVPGYCLIYEQNKSSGSHIWYNSTLGAAAGDIATAIPAMTLDINGNLILRSSATPATLGTNGQLTVNATSNTNLRFSYRGSDGVTRVANITLA